MAESIKRVKEYGSKINSTLRAIQTEGPSIYRYYLCLTCQPDLKAEEAFGRPGCVLDKLSKRAGKPQNVPFTEVMENFLEQDS